MANTAEPIMAKLIGMHGGMTAVEQYVPLLCALG